MALATFTGNLSQNAKAAFQTADGGPFLLADWVRTVFIHYEVAPEVLQPQVPWPLDLREGRAYVSLVAFTMKRLRLGFGGRFTEWLSAPIANQGFLNLRTYVHHQGEPGVYFLAEWLPSAISVVAGPRVFGLPYRRGRLDYRHEEHEASLRGRVTAVGAPGVLAYQAAIDPAAAYAPSEADSLEEFLIERYTAFTLERSVQRLFRIWHEPWQITPIHLQMEETSLLAQTGPWLNQAKLHSAAYSAGVQEVWIGRPHCINGPACLRQWPERPDEKK